MSTKKQSSGIFLLHLPPPVHGSSIMGKAIKESGAIKEAFPNSVFINLLASSSVSESGKFKIGKVVGAIRIIGLLWQALWQKPSFCYLALTTTGFAFYRDVLLVALVKCFRVKRIYHLHNKGVAQKSGNPIHRFFYRFVFDKADVILLSRLLYPDISLFVPEKYIHILPNGIPDVTVGVPPRQTDHHKLPVILFLSNLITSKGVFELLEACSVLKKRGIAFRCHFVGGEGDISCETFQKRVAEMALQNEVQYLGRKLGEAKMKIYNMSSVFAFPTFYDKETFGLVLLEAMQSGLPVVSTPEGGIPDIVLEGKTGFLVPQRDAAALADKLETLLRDEGLRKTMGAAGRRRFEEQFTLEKFEHNLLHALQQSIA